ncbi:MAG: gliding motility-associated C-terminal domain-containing protein [Elusimicrobia bacterium]|nr:gliding motility-associated C-terminal domain-containing protein [Elusimicrobiota bacterium]
MNFLKVAFILGMALAKSALGYSLEVELRNVGDNQLSSIIDFGRVRTNKTHWLAKQYHKLIYQDMEYKEIHIYTDNSDWQGEKDLDRSGLILSSTLKTRVPLYWLDFPSTQAQDFTLTEETESSWKTIEDKNNKDFTQRKKETTSVKINSNGTTYLYLGTKIPNGKSAPGKYKTKIIFEVINLAPDTKAPRVSQIQQNKKAFFANETISFKAKLEDDTQIKSATLFYKYKEESDFKSRPMTLTQNIQNPFEYLAQITFAKQELKEGEIEYYIVGDDGFNKTSLGNIQVPIKLEILNEFSPVTDSISSSGGKFRVQEGDSSGNATELIFPAGSIRNEIKISAKKLNAQALPSMNGQVAVNSFEFGPEGTIFNRPITMKLNYSDSDQDGIVDGTNLNEKELRLFWYDGFSWRNLGGKVDENTNTVTGEVSHFSIYGLLPAGESKTDEIRTKEKIITPNGDGINDFAQFGVSGQFEINIYNSSGKRIKKIENNNIWDGKNDSGETAQSGVYLYQIKTGETLVSGTIGVAK